MGWFIFAIIVIVLGFIGLFLGLAVRKSEDDDTRLFGNVAVFVAALALLAGGATLFFDSYTVVPARNVGVVNTFGKAEGALSNGFHWVKPYSSIETVDATVQNINRDSDTKNCITARLQSQATACADVTLQWNIDQNANANELWQRYRGNNDDVVGNIGRNVVERELQRALNRVFESYNPLSVLQNGQSPTKTDDLAAEALKIMKANVDRGIVIDTLLISVVHFDDTTQAKLNAYAQAIADTQIAGQVKATNEQIKAANDLLVSTSSNDPGVKYQNCLNLIKDLAAKNQLQNLPVNALSCDAGALPVIVGQK